MLVPTPRRSRESSRDTGRSASSATCARGFGRRDGIAVATYTDGQNLNFAIPVSYLHDLLRKNQTLAPLAASKPQVQQHSALDKLHGKQTQGVEIDKLTWEIINRGRGDFVLTFRNRLRVPIRNVRALVVFRDDKGPIDFTEVMSTAGQVIPPGLGKPARGKVDDSTFSAIANEDGAIYMQLKRERFEVRVLDFEIVEETKQ
jgi:hypothetical protein